MQSNLKNYVSQWEDWIRSEKKDLAQILLIRTKLI